MWVRVLAMCAVLCLFAACGQDDAVAPAEPKIFSATMVTGGHSRCVEYSGAKMADFRAFLVMSKAVVGQLGGTYAESPSACSRAGAMGMCAEVITAERGAFARALVGETLLTIHSNTPVEGLSLETTHSDLKSTCGLNNGVWTDL